MKTLGLGLGAVILIALGWFGRDYYPISSVEHPLSPDGNQPILISDGTVDVFTQGNVGEHQVLYTGTVVKSILLSTNSTRYTCKTDTPGSGNPPCLEVDHKPKTGSVMLRNYQNAISLKFDPSLAAWKLGSSNDDTSRHLAGESIVSTVLIDGVKYPCAGAAKGCSVTVCLSTTAVSAACP